MSEKAKDHRPTEKQISLAIWFASYKRKRLPKKVYLSNIAWWNWINAMISPHDKDHAREATIDFGKSVNRDDPVSVIGALKYLAEYEAKSVEEHAMDQIRKNVHPYLVAEQFRLSDEKIEILARRVEADGYEIDWGSV